VYDVDEGTANAFANGMRKEFNVDVQTVDDLTNALAASDICVTCTPSKKYFIHRNQVKAGTFIAAIGADNEDKQELDPKLLVGNKIIVDSLEQASTIGELHHALKANVINLQDVYAELGEVITGMKNGREFKNEIIIFDSTGTALQDVAAAAIVYEKAIKKSRSPMFEFTD
jgi:alanine dehydrogenase